MVRIAFAVLFYKQTNWWAMTNSPLVDMSNLCTIVPIFPSIVLQDTVNRWFHSFPGTDSKPVDNKSCDTCLHKWFQWSVWCCCLPYHSWFLNPSSIHIRIGLHFPCIAAGIVRTMLSYYFCQVSHSEHRHSDGFIALLKGVLKQLWLTTLLLQRAGVMILRCFYPLFCLLRLICFCAAW